jgi:YD repeat-containing protein
LTERGGSVVSFQYDPFGRRTYKSSPAGSTTYVYDGDNIVEELTGSTGTLGERYTYGPGIDEPLGGWPGRQVEETNWVAHASGLRLGLLISVFPVFIR